MTEDEAKGAAAALVSSESFERLEVFSKAVLQENSQQNLIAASTAEVIWRRHILDSLQLLRFSADGGDWIDIGTGAGFPGLVVAIATAGARQVLLVEPRRSRAGFLVQMIDELALARWTSVHQQRVETLQNPPAGNISARAVSSVEKLLLAGRHCATIKTRWILPRGRVDQLELDALRRKWEGVFHVEQSITDPLSKIIVATGVKKR